jgi:hypothetical protein
LDLFPSGPRPVLHESGPAPAGRSDTFDFTGSFDTAPTPEKPAGARYERLMTDFTREFYIPDETGADQYAEDAPAVELPAGPVEPEPARPAGISTKITGALLGVLFITSCIMGGFGTGLFVVAVFLLLTALYTITTGRGSWARLASRKLIAAAVGAAVVLFMLSAVVSPRHTDDTKPPSPAHTAPAKPAPKAKK